MEKIFEVRVKDREGFIRHNKSDMLQPLSPDDIVVWPDDSWCFRSELEEYTWKSDDYRWILISDSEYEEFMRSQGFD